MKGRCRVTGARAQVVLAPALAGVMLCGRLAGEATHSPDGSAPSPQVITTKSGVEMVRIPGAWFEMGSAKGMSDERPVHKVWVDEFYIDRYELTQELYGKLVLGNPSHFKGPKRPMEQVSWARAAVYCNERSRAEGLEPCYDEDTAECNFEANGYRLPTEAEWEYACRAGTETEYPFGNGAAELPAHAWHAANSAETTRPVGQKKPNPWGLYDLLGNVAEWCNDIYRDDYYEQSPLRNPRGAELGENHVLRGGSWKSVPKACRPAFRVGDDPGFQDSCFARDDIGFRCVRRQGHD